MVLVLSSLFSVVLLTVAVQWTGSTVCRSVRIHNHVEGLKALQNCTVVEGFIKIMLIQKNITNFTPFEPFSFPRLREITEFLLLYEVWGLRTIGTLFPNLERIGGEVLFTQESALVIVKALNLQEVGLYSLREITRGSVAVVSNPELCYLNTIAWNSIMKWDAATTHFHSNSDSHNCPVCPKTCPQERCWNSTKCQIEEGEHACHPLCVGGCRGPATSDCYTCRGVLDSEGSCVEHCPPNTFQLHNRRCVTREECINYWHIEDPRNNDGSVDLSGKNHTYVVFKDKCFKSCPALYEVNSEQECVECPLGKCEKTCVGGMINSIEDAHRFRGCTYIKSSIGIQLRLEFTDTVREELEDSLGSIERINGYLKITRSSITDLKFLKNLQAIEGNDAQEKYALYVVDNPNIQELWDWTTKKTHITIKGRLFFHYNPKLCLQKIYAFLEVSGYETTNSDFEIGKGSNGDKIPCNTTTAKISVNFTSFNFIRIRIPYIEEESSTPFRYVVYYTKDNFKNITMFEDLDPCSDSGWKTVDKSDLDSDDLVTLSDLEPDTQYVCYFTTYSEKSIGARSELFYLTTLPTKPSELESLHATSNSSSQVHLWWEPPKHINGKLKEYVITWYELPDDESLLDLRDYCTDSLEFSMALRAHEVKIPKTKNISNDCSCSHSHVPKEGFGQLCKNFGNLEFPVGFTKKSKSMSCESYFSSYVSTSPFRLASHEAYTSQKSKIIGPNTLFREDDENNMSESKSLSKSRYSSRKTQEDGMKVVSGNMSETVLYGLKHFSTYAVTVKACREASAQEPDTSEENRCSMEDIVITRTQKLNFADNITSLNYTVTKQTLQVFWKAPRKPNGLLLAFEFELKRNNHDSETIECIRYSNKDLGSIQYSKSDLSIGKYEFRVRAVSLSGKGLFTRFYSFEVLDETAYSDLELLLLILLIFVFVSVITVLTHFLTRQNYKPIDTNLVADCNPNYHYTPDPVYEIPRENIVFGDEIGFGTFGKVYKGVLKPGNTRCAIKTMIENASTEMEGDFLREAELMKLLNSAHFVVKLLGVVSRDSPPLVLMELMALGDLKNYLRSTRETQSLGNATMIRMAVEIADAMTFMEAHKFVHRDLAARNCMVGEDLTIKVGDFGMARDIYETDYYRKTDQELLPIRWMAPESLRDGEFSSLSDVWSYGVVLWEIVSRAEQPYQGLSNDQVLQEVIAGATLDTPARCPRPLAVIMTKCWRYNASNRANFMQIMLSLSHYHKHDYEFRRLAYFYTPEAEKRRDPKYVEMQPLEVPLLQAVDFTF